MKALGPRLVVSSAAICLNECSTHYNNIRRSSSRQQMITCLHFSIRLWWSLRAPTFLLKEESLLLPPSTTLISPVTQTLKSAQSRFHLYSCLVGTLHPPTHPWMWDAWGWSSLQQAKEFPVALVTFPFWHHAVQLVNQLSFHLEWNRNCKPELDLRGILANPISNT